jgi:hypothetical protein
MAMVNYGPFPLVFMGIVPTSEASLFDWIMEKLCG